MPSFRNRRHTSSALGPWALPERNLLACPLPKANWIWRDHHSDLRDQHEGFGKAGQESSHAMIRRVQFAVSYEDFTILPGKTMEILAGKTALVTGASSGIGRATALALAEAGADLAINFLTHPESAETLGEEVRALGRRAALFPVDVAEQSAVEAMVAETVQEFGGLHIFVANAFYSDEELFHQADMAGFRRTIDVTMWGAFFGFRAAAKQMIRQGGGGNLVAVSSPHAREAIPASMAYNMAKAAVDQMARTAAVELLPHRVRVNIVHPGWTDTPGERKYFSEEYLARVAPTLPWGRLARPEEIARAILFLVDPASDYVTGSTLTIDGGLQLPWWSKRGRGEL
jgi:glucose 1-dehydrogenase